MYYFSKKEITVEEIKNLKELTKRISGDLLDTINMLDILKEITDGECKEDFLICSIQKNVKNAFKHIEYCRQLISIPD